jgi:DNA polymerase
VKPKYVEIPASFGSLAVLIWFRTGLFGTPIFLNHEWIANEQTTTKKPAGFSREFIETAAHPGWIVCAHNDGFETAIEQHIMTPRLGWPLIPLERHRCTMAAASALGSPARLGMAADALELANRKDVAGERLMLQMSKPRRARQGENPSQVHWFDDDDDRLRRLYDYCRQDVEVERELFDRLPLLSVTEQTLWAQSCRINERGFCVDRQFAEAARRIAQAAAPEIDAELAEITSGLLSDGGESERSQKRWLSLASYRKTEQQ